MKKKEFYESNLFPFSWEIFLTNYRHVKNEYECCIENLLKTNRELAETSKVNDLVAIEYIEKRRVRLCRIRDRMQTALACGNQMYIMGLNHDLYKYFFEYIFEIYEIEGDIR